MHLDDFDYNLPNELIADYPLTNRSDSRLLYLPRENSSSNIDEIVHSRFNEIDKYLNAGDLLILNDSKVIPARLYGNKESGGKVEILIEKIFSKNEILAHIKASKSPNINSILYISNIELTVLEKNDGLYKLKILENDIDVLLKEGHIPLPPYIKRNDKEIDIDRYQTVYAKSKGSVAAPTAGLHFDEEIISRLKAKGILIAFVTLHVGSGTFMPIRGASIEEHVMHEEFISLTDETVDAIIAAKNRGNKVVAVGTTSVRVLESAFLKNNELRSYSGNTNIFIKPGFRFNVVDALITNFHLPKSTLLLLVSAFAGTSRIKMAYRNAILNRYRFYSYGDAMFLERSYEV